MEKSVNFRKGDKDRSPNKHRSKSKKNEKRSKSKTKKEPKKPVTYDRKREAKRVTSALQKLELVEDDFSPEVIEKDLGPDLREYNDFLEDKKAELKMMIKSMPGLENDDKQYIAFYYIILCRSWAGQALNSNRAWTSVYLIPYFYKIFKSDGVKVNGVNTMARRAAVALDHINDLRKFHSENGHLVDRDNWEKLMNLLSDWEEKQVAEEPVKEEHVAEEHVAEEPVKEEPQNYGDVTIISDTILLLSQATLEELFRGEIIQ